MKLSADLKINSSGTQDDQFYSLDTRIEKAQEQISKTNQQGNKRGQRIVQNAPYFG